MKLYLDPGHGGSDPGAQGHGLNEKDITLDIALKLRDILLNEYQNVEIRMSRTGDTTKSLRQRTQEANAFGADFYLSIHINSAGSSAQGYEDYIYPGASSESKRVRDIIHAEVMKVNELRDRGKKQANFHVLRETKMPAVLTENGFISNAHDAALMKQSSWRQKVARGHANALAIAFGLKRKTVTTPVPTPAPKPGTLYKVMAGSFKARKNADEQVTQLRAKGFDAFVVTTTISGTTWYRVQVGAFSSRENADKHLTLVKKAGFTDSFIVVDDGGSSGNSKGSSPASPPRDNGGSSGTGSNSGSTGGAGNGQNENNGENSGNSPQPPSTQGFPILGPTILSPKQMNDFVKTVNPNAPELGNLYFTIGEYYGIRGDIAFAQALHETDFFRFTGIVQPSQNNYAGIGATGPDRSGATFETPEEGVIAHLQHLFAYATATPLPNQYPLVDPRFHLVERGSAPTWTDLNGKWAVPGTTYGQSILDLYKRMLRFSAQNLENLQKEIQS